MAKCDEIIARITKKFYQTEEERLAKLESDKEFITFFLQEFKNEISYLFNLGIKMHVFHHTNDTIHIGLFPCCRKKPTFTPDMWTIIDDKLHDFGFTNVVWEDPIAGGE